MVFWSNRYLSIIVTSISWCIKILSWCSFCISNELTFTSKYNDNKYELIDYSSYSTIYSIIIIIFHLYLFVSSISFFSRFIVHCFVNVCMCMCFMTEKKDEKPGYVARQNSYYCYSILALVNYNTNEQTENSDTVIFVRRTPLSLSLVVSLPRGLLSTFAYYTSFVVILFLLFVCAMRTKWRYSISSILLVISKY
jgi:hypothetical protein